MSLEKHFPTFTNSNEKSNENLKEVKKNKNEVKEKTKSLGRKSFPYLAALSTFFGVSKGVEAQNNNKTEEKIEIVANPKPSLKLPDDRIMNFKTKKDKEEFLDLSRLKESESVEIDTKRKRLIGNGDLETVYKNKVANAQERNKFQERNVFNSIQEAEELIEKDGYEKHAYFPGQIAEKSPFWKTTGKIKINNMDDYKAHIEENLLPEGFKGDMSPNIEYFGFKLEKDEFITDLKYNTIVKAAVKGGAGYVPLLKGTRVVFERVILENGEVCNILKAILDCKNPIYGDYIYLRDGSKLYIRQNIEENKISFSKEKDGEYVEYKRP